MFRHFFRFHMAFSLVTLVFMAAMAVFFMHRSVKYKESNLEESLQAINNQVQQQLLQSPRLKLLLQTLEDEEPSDGHPITRLQKRSHADIISQNELRKISSDNGNSQKDEGRKTERRKSLLIFGHDRSGTTFLSRMFNADPQMFNVYEPLWVTKFSFKPTGDTRIILDVLKGLLGCNFSKTASGVQFLSNISEWWSIRVNSAAMISRHFCTIQNGKADNCQDMSRTPERTDQVCLERYKHSVSKIATTRTPEHRISTLIPRIFEENPDVDLKVLHVVRDPRGNIHSRMKLKWFQDYPHAEFELKAKEICDEVAYNMKYVQQQIAIDEENGQKRRFMTVTYNEIAGNPLQTAEKIYQFAGFKMAANMTEWILKSTRPSKETLRKALEHPYSHVRNATGNAERWKKESPIGRVRAIERVCGPLMQILGLEKIG